jgi:hypothetical protein
MIREAIEIGKHPSSNIKPEIGLQSCTVWLLLFILQPFFLTTYTFLWMAHLPSRPLWYLPLLWPGTQRPLAGKDTPQRQASNSPGKDWELVMNLRWGWTQRRINWMTAGLNLVLTFTSASFPSTLHEYECTAVLMYLRALLTATDTHVGCPIDREKERGRPQSYSACAENIIRLCTVLTSFPSFCDLTEHRHTLLWV